MIEISIFILCFYSASTHGNARRKGKITPVAIIKTEYCGPRLLSGSHLQGFCVIFPELRYNQFCSCHRTPALQFRRIKAHTSVFVSGKGLAALEAILKFLYHSAYAAATTNCDASANQ